MEEIIRALKDDNVEQIFEEAPEGFFLLPPPSYLPQILRKKPNLIAFAAYYGASKCFTAISKLNDQTITNCDTEKRDAIHFAVSQDQSLFVQKLCEEYDQQYNQDINKWTPLHYAAFFNAKKTIDVLLPYYSFMNIKDVDGYTPLHLVKDKEIALKLLEKGAKINQRSNDGTTPILSAAKRGDYSMVSFFYEKGAKIESKNKIGWNIFHYTAQSGNSRCFKTVFKLIDNKNLIFSVDQSGRSPLHYASEQGDPKIVVFLLKHGLDPNVQDNNGLTSLHFAVSEGNLVAVRALIGCGADPSIVDNTGRNPLHFAAGSKSSELVEMFSRILDIHCSTKQGMLPIHFAAINNNPDAINILADNDTINATNCYGKTPLSLSVENGANEVIDILLKKGAIPNISDKAGMQPIDRALLVKNDEAFELLSEVGSILSPKWKSKRLQHVFMTYYDESPVSSPKIRSMLY